jgi:hypothetical protein
MWESKDNALDATYNADHIWFDGIGGQHTQKTADIRKWEDSKVHKLIEKRFPNIKADKMLAELSSIIVEPIDSTRGSPDRSETARPSARSSETPHVPETPARLEQMKFQRQQAVITSWIDDPRHAADATCRHALKLYAQLTDSEFLYVSDLKPPMTRLAAFSCNGFCGRKSRN